MDDNLTEERARAEAYGLWGLVALADAELARRAVPSGAPEGRQAPAMQAAAATAPGDTARRPPGRPRGK